MLPVDPVTKIQIVRFWTEYMPAPTPQDALQMRAIDKVAYCPLGMASKCVTVESVGRLSKVQPLAAAENNPAVTMAHMRWEAIRPHYENWKAGHETPPEGTPLAAWNGLSPEQAELLRGRGVRTLEELVSLSDTHLQNFGIAGLRGLIDQARRFLGSQDTARAAAELAARDERIAALEAQLSDLTEVLGAKRPDDEARDGRGRFAKRGNAAA
jgi:hypothetical protein